MAIIGNEACPECQDKGHDRRGNHLMVFEDGGKFCNRAHFHENGKAYYLPADGRSSVLDKDITGQIKYTPNQFKELVAEGKLDNPQTRDIALSGMRGEDRWHVSNEAEQEAMLKERGYDEEYYNTLSFKNLMSRHIRGDIAKFYGVKAGLGSDGKVSRHYYPVFDIETGEWRGAKCRTLPKDFRYGQLGWTWGESLMFGQQTIDAVLDAGGRMDTLLLVGGECDAMAAQQMLRESRKGTKYEAVPFHVWSPCRGEKAINDILNNRDAIGKFKRIITGFDNDEVGETLNKEIARLFPTKVYKMVYPAGIKDPNDCLMYGKSKEFVDGWFNPEECIFKGSVRPASAYRKKAKVQVEMGLSYPIPELNRVTFGIREYYLGVWGAGTGVGKTAWTKEVVHHLAYTHGVPVQVIYLEEPPERTVKSFAGKLVNKDFTVPAIHDENDPDYTEASDYTQEVLDDAVDRLCDDGLIFVGDLDGRKDADKVMEVMEEARMMGIKHFVVDNLTAFQHIVDGKVQTGAVAIDETMRRLGTFKDEHPVHIMLLSHLIKVHPSSGRTPFNEGGEVLESDFRGAGSITFWANGVFSQVRNVKAPTLQEKSLTYIESIKNRDNGRCVGDKVYMRINEHTGHFVPVVNRATSFDTGTGDSNPTNKPETPSDMEEDF